MELSVNITAGSPLKKLTADSQAPTRAYKQNETAGVELTSGSDQLPAIQAKESIAAGDLSQADQATTQTIKRFVFEHDDLSGLSVVKCMDSRGNVVLQVPPEQYLRAVQMLKEFGGMELQAFSGEKDYGKATGLLLNKKV